MVDNVLYLSTMYTPRVAALDAETGAELWTFDPRAYEGGPKGAGPRSESASSTGASPMSVAGETKGDDARIFLNSRDRHGRCMRSMPRPVYELEAPGHPGFGDGGTVLLTEGHGRPVTRFEFDQTSPPVVFEDLVIVGSRIPDRLQRKFDPPGTVQAFDARTGERRWVFFTIPQSRDDLWRGHLGGRVVALHRPRQRVGADVARCRARTAVRADEHAEQRLLGRPPGGGEPLRRIAGVPGRAHG